MRRYSAMRSPGLDRVAEAPRAIGVPQLREILAELAAPIRVIPAGRCKPPLRHCAAREVRDPGSRIRTIQVAVAAQRPGIFPESVALLPGFEPGFKP